MYGITKDELKWNYLCCKYNTIYGQLGNMYINNLNLAIHLSYRRVGRPCWTSHFEFAKHIKFEFCNPLYTFLHKNLEVYHLIGRTQNQILIYTISTKFKPLFGNFDQLFRYPGPLCAGPVKHLSLTLSWMIMIMLYTCSTDPQNRL